MNQNWKISTTAMKHTKNINKLKKGVLIKYVPQVIAKSTYKLSTISKTMSKTKSEINIKPILDYIKMRITYLKIEQACTYEPESDLFVPVCCMCFAKIEKKNYVCTSTSCISEFLKELTDDSSRLSRKQYESSYRGYMYDYDSYNGHADCMDAYEEEYNNEYYEYPCSCAEEAGYNFMGACNDCGTCRCGSCIDMCRCDIYQDDDYHGGF